MLLPKSRLLPHRLQPHNSLCTPQLLLEKFLPIAVVGIVTSIAAVGNVYQQPVGFEFHPQSLTLLLQHVHPVLQPRLFPAQHGKLVLRVRGGGLLVDKPWR